MFGTRQTGMQQLKIANLVRDRELIPLVEKMGKTLGQKKAQSQGLITRWVRHSERYADV